MTNPVFDTPSSQYDNILGETSPKEVLRSIASSNCARDTPGFLRFEDSQTPSNGEQSFS